MVAFTSKLNLVVLVSFVLSLGISAAPLPNGGSAYSGTGGQADGGNVVKTQQQV
jgi:hypothetical protein